tara:strand:- start:64 stop:432 length:369 start_codon:yes stop_codon:yes gene_type:complete
MKQNTGYHPGGSVRRMPRGMSRFNRMGRPTGRPMRRGRPTLRKPQVASRINAPSIGTPSTRRTPPSMANPISRFNQANRRSLGRLNQGMANPVQAKYTYANGGLTKSTSELNTGLKKARESK